MENEKLIAALRNHANMDSITQKARMMCHSAADALELLTAESAEKDAEIKRLKKHTEDLRLDYCDLLADRDRLQAELDAAVEDMNHIAREIAQCDLTLAKDGEKVGSLHLGRCAVCSHKYCDEEIDGGCKFEWRGPQEAGEGTEE